MFAKAAMTEASEKRYEKKRRERQRYNAPFIAIDSEGCAHGPCYAADDKSYQPHKSFLWGAGDVQGAVKWLYSATPLATSDILEFLLDVGEANPGANFISFAFGYDVAQALTDLPY